jgi:hypothetical protein
MGDVKCIQHFDLKYERKITLRKLRGRWEKILKRRKVLGYGAQK